MPAARALSSVAHNTAHHAASGMSWLHPHACRAARAEGLGELRFDLLAASPLTLRSIGEPLRAATEGLREKFVAMLEQHGFSVSVLGSALLVMWFPTSDECYCVTTCRLETTDGRVFEKSCSSFA